MDIKTWKEQQAKWAQWRTILDGIRQAVGDERYHALVKQQNEYDRVPLWRNDYSANSGVTQAAVSLRNAIAEQRSEHRWSWPKEAFVQRTGDASVQAFNDHYGAWRQMHHRTVTYASYPADVGVKLTPRSYRNDLFEFNYRIPLTYSNMIKRVGSPVCGDRLILHARTPFSKDIYEVWQLKVIEPIKNGVEIKTGWGAFVRDMRNNNGFSTMSARAAISQAQSALGRQADKVMKRA